MLKDGISDMVTRVLKTAYDDITRERIPDDIRALVEKLK